MKTEAFQNIVYCSIVCRSVVYQNSKHYCLSPDGMNWWWPDLFICSVSIQVATVDLWRQILAMTGTLVT